MGEENKGVFNKKYFNEELLEHITIQFQKRD